MVKICLKKRGKRILKVRFIGPSKSTAAKPCLKKRGKRTLNVRFAPTTMDNLGNEKELKMVNITKFAKAIVSRASPINKTFMDEIMDKNIQIADKHEATQQAIKLLGELEERLLVPTKYEILAIAQCYVIADSMENLDWVDKLAAAARELSH
tara:strand:- start:93 stop:548 length:456 start_codon:yes stop_codon:yes gene_type:complete